MKKILLTISIGFILLTGINCNKEPKSIFGKTHLVLKKIVSIARELKNADDINQNFNNMKSKIINFSKYLEEIGNMTLNEIERISQLYDKEVNSFYKYLNSILKEKDGGFIGDMKRIGSLSIEGQNLRNAFFEAIFVLKQKVSDSLNRQNNPNQ